MVGCVWDSRPWVGSTRRKKGTHRVPFSLHRAAAYFPTATVNTTRLSASLPELSRPLPSVP